MQNKLIKLFIPLELLFIILGVTLPLATIDEFWFFSSEFSILSLAYVLFKNSEHLLAIVIVLFGILIPLLKIFQNYMGLDFLNGWSIHKFSMIDIFLISFLIFGGKLSYFYTVNLELGFYFLLAAVSLSYLSLILKQRTKIKK